MGLDAELRGACLIVLLKEQVAFRRSIVNVKKSETTTVSFANRNAVRMKLLVAKALEACLLVMKGITASHQTTSVALLTNSAL
eukprot:CAMPEP_0171467388 /NCGR_PEP_ID=MMETSP0945-20130129/9933_1 /TAXON_ID=109269 /ORGANISM="Vaucheria litorea, Strain CCMP2940" /LENGTH=82 /DNA_ID=CAMNT_0011995879 /DNA_START=324 /DNA_END=569 /DNA_ORIENTATION=-